MKLSVLMPVWNERATIEEIVRRVREVPLDAELIIVDNISTDGTRQWLQSLIDDGEATDEDGNGRLRVCLQRENKGKGDSVRRAIALARGDWIIVQDADLEYDPRDYVKLLAVGERAARQSGRAVAVFGTRLSPGSQSFADQPRTTFFFGRIALSLIYRLLFARPLSDVATCYKLMPRDVAQSLDLRSNGFDLDFEIAARLTRRGIFIREVPISYAPRTHGEGKKIRPLHDGARAVWALVKYRFQ